MAELSFFLSKFLWLFVAPANLFCLAFLVGAFFALSNHAGRKRFGQRLCFILSLLLFLLATLPIGQWLLTPLENLYPASRPAQVDGIILLGGDESSRLTTARGEPNVLASGTRYLKFIELAAKYPNAKLVFTGGSNKVHAANDLSQAAIAQQIIAKSGIDPTRVIYEDRSRNTYENAAFTGEIVKPSKDENWLLVTSAYHLPRAMGCFRQAGWNVYAAPAGYLTAGGYGFGLDFDVLAHLVETHIALREYVGLLGYAMLGRVAWPW